MLLGAAIVAGLVLTLIHAGQEVYYIPGYGVAIAAGAGVIAVAAIGVGWRARRGRVVALAAIGGALTVLGLRHRIRRRERLLRAGVRRRVG